MEITLHDDISVSNNELIGGLVMISEGFIDEEDCAEERFVLQRSAARIVTLVRASCFFFTGFVVSNAFWIYNYLFN